MSTEEKQELLSDIAKLQELKVNTSDFIEQMEIAGSIHEIEMLLNGTKPTNSIIDCEGCGS